ncbi:MAG: 50S ribosomal protein L15 [Bdellovibrionaceae bacterium]|nr:50S ribosomal protein L15 [Bdellovibrionales bacterium]MCB9253952.1 50S ribosomal protein L15 [Pseudobdellovibrionaceae bacterium]
MAEQQAQLDLSNLEAPEGSRKKRVRVGRGIGSGLGKTAGRGGKGQTARQGKGRPPGFEGGQIPLYRRLPKFGFNNPTRKSYKVVNLNDLDARFKDGDAVTPESLVESGLVRTAGLIKVLGNGKITKKLTVKAHKFSKSAIQKINQAGGSVEEIKS